MSNEIAVRESGVPVILPFEEVVQMAKSAAESGLFGQMKPQQALVLMMFCQAEGIHPMQGMRRYHVINNRIVMRADAMQGEFQSRGGDIEFHERNDVACDATFTWGRMQVRVVWNMERARNLALSRPAPDSCLLQFSGRGAQAVRTGAVRLGPARRRVRLLA